MKNQVIIIGVLALLTLFFCPVANAIELDANSIAEITTDANHNVIGYEQTFAVSGNVAVWIDNRDPGWIPRIYGVNLSDPNYLEFLIDSNAPGCSEVAFSWPLVTYDIQEQGGAQYLRVANITNQQNPFIFQVNPLIPYASNFAISGSVIAYVGSDPNNDWQDTIYVADVSDPNNIRQYTIAVLLSDSSAAGLALDANYVTWSADSWDANDYVQVADITNPNDPVIVTAFLPPDISFYQLDTSGDWLVASGWCDWNSRIYAVHRYADVNSWDIEILWKEGDNGEYYVSGPRIDGPIAVWMVTSRIPSLGSQSVSSDSSDEYLLRAGYLMGNGGFTLSVLRRSCLEISAADIANSQVVWSQRNQEFITDLFKGSIMLECGDWGYKLADLNLDCNVDFLDFAYFASDWLECTTPNDMNCEPGSFSFRHEVRLPRE